jgi:hypothetical protein
LSATTSTKTQGSNWPWILAGLVLLSLILRGWAALRLPLDYDEPVYLQAGLDYARALRAGDLNGVIDYAENREHPALGKVLYGLTALVVGQDADWQVALYAGRLLSALFGTLAVLLLALFDPLAGGFLAAHTLAVKYTAQVYLEALPHLASLAAVLALARSTGARDRWFWLSAVALGVTAAGKFTYLPIGFVLLYLAVWEKRIRWCNLLLYALVAAAVFWLLNPTLWRDPLSRLGNSLFFHIRYSQGSRVELASLPWYQPLHWISRSSPSVWHPDVYFYFALDGVIFLLALPGLYWEWRERRWVVVWIVTSLIFLLVWPTKWPQYTLVLTPALCLAASSAAKHLYRWLRERETYWLWVRQMIPAPPLAFWIISAALIVAIVVGYTAFTMQLTLGRLGWSHMTTASTQLPSRTVYDILAGPDDQMILGTERGAAIWSPPVATDLPDRWIVFTTENSGLPHDRVLALSKAEGLALSRAEGLDPTGDGGALLWFGTEAGLARYDGTAWQVYKAEDLGLEGDQVYALATGSDGRLWAGTSTGAAVYDGQTWTPLTAATSGLADDRVLSLAVEPRPGGDRVWFGTQGSISRLDTATGEWTDFAETFAGSATDLLFDSAGRLWAGTLGGGLGLWDGMTWQFYRTGNSEIPHNTVTVVVEVEPGVLWVGTAPAAEVGGVLAEFDGETWKTYARHNSGYSAAEPLAIDQDGQGRWWIGTRTAGVDVYQANH